MFFPVLSSTQLEPNIIIYTTYRRKMFKLKFKKLSKILNNNKLVPESIRNNLIELAKIEIFLQQNLPAELQMHCFPLTINKRRLTMSVDSTAIHTRLRFVLPTLEQDLRQYTHQQIQSIDIKVYPANPVATVQPEKQKTRRAALSEQTREHLSSMANEMEDSDLKQALIRLSRNKKIGTQ